MADRDVVGQGFYVLDLDDDDFNRALSRAERNAAELGDAADAVSRDIRALNRTMDRVGDLDIDVDATGIDEALREMRALDRSADRVSDIQIDVDTRGLESARRAIDRIDGDIEIEVDARGLREATNEARRLDRALDRASMQAGELARDLRGTGAAGAFAGLRSGALAAGAAVTGIVAGFTAIGASAVRATRELQRWTDIAGVSARRGQVFQRIAQRTASDLDSVADAQKELNLRVDEFLVTGAGPAAEAIERLGFDENTARQLLDTEQGLERVIDAVLQLDSAAARGRVLDELLGGTGAEAIAPLVEQLNRAGQSAEELFDQFERGLLSQADIDQVAEFGSSLQRLGETFRTRFAQIIAQELGFLEPFFNALTRLLENAIDRASEDPQRLAERLRADLQQVEQQLERAMQIGDPGSIRNLERRRDEITTALAEASAALDRQAAEQAASSQEVVAANDQAARSLSELSDRLLRASDDAVDALLPIGQLRTVVETGVMELVDRSGEEAGRQAVAAARAVIDASNEAAVNTAREAAAAADARQAEIERLFAPEGGLPGRVVEPGPVVPEDQGTMLGQVLVAGVRPALETLRMAVDGYDRFLERALPRLAASYGSAVDTLEDVVEEVRQSGIGDELRAFAEDVRNRSVAEFEGTLAVVREDARRLGRTLNGLLEETLIPGVEAATATLGRVAEQSVLTVATTALVPLADFAADAAGAVQPILPALLQVVRPFRQLAPAASRLADLLLGPTFGSRAQAAANEALAAQTEAQAAVAQAEQVLSLLGAQDVRTRAAIARAEAAVVAAEQAGELAESLAAQPSEGRDPIAALASDDTIRRAAESIGAVLQPMAQLGEAAGVVSSAFAGLPPHALALQVVFDSMLGVLGPAITEVLRPLFAVLALIGQTVGQLLEPAFRILGRVAETLGETFRWLYNNVFRHVGNLIIAIFNAIIDVYNATLGRIFGSLDRVQPLDEILRDEFLSLADRFLMEPLVQGDTNITRFQQQRPINLTVNNEGNYVIGDDGLDEFAELVAQNITRNDRLAYG